MSGGPAGTCRFCACKGNACRLADGDACCWLDRRRICCTNPACLRANAAERRQADEQQARANRKRTPAEINALIRSRGRKRTPKHTAKPKAGAA